MEILKIVLFKLIMHVLFQGRPVPESSLNVHEKLKHQELVKELQSIHTEIVKVIQGIHTEIVKKTTIIHKNIIHAEEIKIHAEIFIAQIVVLNRTPH